MFVKYNYHTLCIHVCDQQFSIKFPPRFPPLPKDCLMINQSMYVFFWVFPWHPIVVFRRFGTLYQFHLQGLDVKYEVYFTSSP